MRTLVITGTHPRHQLFIGAVEQQLKVAAYILCKREAMIPPPPRDLSKELQDLWELHFYRRDEAERRFFRPTMGMNSTANVLEIPPEELNEASTIEWYLKQKPFDLVLLSGCPIIKDPFFAFLPEWRVNMHLGLIPEFKGTMSPFWTHYMLKPNWNGCTYHVIGQYVDTGEILHQTVPQMVATDGLHDSACRSYLKACDDIGKVLEFVEDSLTRSKYPVPDISLLRKGKLFTKADWHAGLLRNVYETYQDRITQFFLDGRLPRVEGPRLVKLGVFK